MIVLYLSIQTCKYLEVGKVKHLASQRYFQVRLGGRQKEDTKGSHLWTCTSMPAFANMIAIKKLIAETVYEGLLQWDYFWSLFSSLFRNAVVHVWENTAISLVLLTLFSLEAYDSGLSPPSSCMNLYERNIYMYLFYR